jgi:hypothetical protein
MSGSLSRRYAHGFWGCGHLRQSDKYTVREREKGREEKIWIKASIWPVRDCPPRAPQNKTLETAKTARDLFSQTGLFCFERCIYFSKH